MKQASLVAAAAVILVANATALIHAARNRMGNETEITLTSRELTHHESPGDSGVALTLAWADTASRFESRLPRAKRWLDEQKLRDLGFDCSVSPTDEKAQNFYARQVPRRAFVALEYEGAAWQAWLDSYQRNVVEHPDRQFAFDSERNSGSRLIPIDAATDAAALRSRYPDRKSVLVLPAVIGIWIQPKAGADAPRLLGSINEIPSTIHVPRPLSDILRDLPTQGNGKRPTVYFVRVRYGKFLEPWVTDAGLMSK